MKIKKFKDIENDDFFLNVKTLKDKVRIDTRLKSKYVRKELAVGATIELDRKRVKKLVDYLEKWLNKSG